MLTIVSWMVFVPAVVWNVLIFCVAFGDIMGSSKVKWWSIKRNWRDLALSLAVLFIPGVYLFGW